MWKHNFYVSCIALFGFPKAATPNFVYNISDINGYKQLLNDTNESTVVCDPNSPRIQCSLVPDELLNCELKRLRSSTDGGNATDVLEESSDFGCRDEDFGKQNFEDVRFVWSKCYPIDADLDCCGDKEFYRKLPCIKYKLKLDDNNYCEYSYPNALLFSFFLGIGGADRFYLGLTASAVGKLFSLGGLGIWWIIDIIFLINGTLMPADGNNWCTNY